MDIQEKKTLLKLLNDYQDETIQKVRSWNSLIDNPYVRKSNRIAKVACYLYLEIAESTLQRWKNEKP